MPGIVWIYKIQKYFMNLFIKRTVNNEKVNNTSGFKKNVLIRTN